VLETLEKLLASETFGRSERARNLLRYLVEQEQAGNADRLKGFAIAVDVFGKDAAFDSATDAVVRVQARRLRELLAQYSASEGADDPVRITIARGTYVPTYELVGERQEASADAAAPPEEATILPAATLADSTAGSVEYSAEAAPAPLPPNPLVMRHLHFFWAAMMVIIAMLGYLVFRMALPGEAGDASIAAGRDLHPEAAAITAAIHHASLPRVYIADHSADAAANRVAAVLRTGLSSFDTVEFIAREAPTPAKSAADALQFVFNVSPGPRQGTVTIELQSSASGKVLFSRVLTAADQRAQVLDDRIADILSSTVPTAGTIYGYIEQNGLASGLISCLLLNEAYYLDQTPQKHEVAYRCLTSLTGADAKSPLVNAELASLHMEAVTDDHPYPPEASEQEALALANRAVQTGATSPYAHRAYGFLNSRIGNQAEAIRWMRKAYELNTYDLTMAASYGYALVLSGNYAAGAPIMERAVEASSVHPSWWDYGLFLAKFMNGDTQRAAEATEALAMTPKSHYLAARLIAADSTGNADLAKTLTSEIDTEFPDFAANPRATFEKAKYPPDLIEKLLTSLRAAGLDSPS
jgi:tetratricopeptide (TPR) repeat protein